MKKTQLYSHENLENTGLFAKLAPQQFSAFGELALECFKPGSLSLKEKEIIAVACAHTLKCAYCIDYHVRLARNAGASDGQISEAAWIGAASAAFETFQGLEETSNWLIQRSQPEEADNPDHAAIYKAYGKFLSKCQKNTSDTQLTLLAINASLMTLNSNRKSIEFVLKEAKNEGCSDSAIIESCFIAVEMSAGACFGHSGQTASILKESQRR